MQLLTNGAVRVERTASYFDNLPTTLLLQPVWS